MTECIAVSQTDGHKIAYFSVMNDDGRLFSSDRPITHRWHGLLQGKNGGRDVSLSRMDARTLAQPDESTGGVTWRPWKRI